MVISNNSNDKVLITGIGTVNPIGNNPDEFWNNLSNGTNGIDKVKSL